MKKILRFLAGLAKTAPARSQHPDMTWWRESRFGMFIHWGLYAIPAGEWKGEKIPGTAEWIMCRAQVPVREYEKLAEQFNPVEFDAEAIAKLASDAGMKYLVITSKHHDGFAMFKSKASPYNVVDATPFKRDVIGELAAACDKQGVRFGVYYSQSQDWHHPNGLGNNWDYADDSEKDFRSYLDDLVLPHLDELLSNYGRMSVFWFDTPKSITAEQSRELLSVVRSKQPECIINSRLGPGAGGGWGDFVSLRDNEVPTVPLAIDGETCATLNGTWGYSKFDSDWKTSEQIVRMQADIAAKNANYLLNIGPDHLGRVPEKSAEILREVGKWLGTNGEAIYSTQPTPFSVNFDWSAVTRRPGKLYFHLLDTLNDVKVVGLRNKADKAYFLDAPEKTFPVRQAPVEAKPELNVTTIETGAVGGEEPHRVLALEIEGEAEVAPGILQQPDGTIILESLAATNDASGESIAPLIIARGSVSRSLEEGLNLSWEFEVLKGGSYTIIADCSTGRGGKRTLDTGHKFVVEVNETVLPAAIREDSIGPIRGNWHWQRITSKIGTVRFDKPGSYKLTLKVEEVNRPQGNERGFILRNLKMSPASMLS